MKNEDQIYLEFLKHPEFCKKIKILNQSKFIRRVNSLVSKYEKSLN